MFFLLTCCFANAESILTVEYLDGKEAQEQLAALSKIVFDKSGNMTFSYNSGNTKDFGNVSGIQKIVFAEGELTNVETQLSGTKIQIYPNPSAETITIVGKNEGEIIKIFNQQGVLALTSSASEINVNQLADGQYFVVVGETVVKLIKK